MRFETLLVHAGVEPDPTTGAIMTPVYLTSTYVQDGVGRPRQGYEYSRTKNPTRTALEASIAALEGGAYALAFASGMAAIDTVMRLLPPGSHVVVGNDVYGGTYRLFERVYRPYGLEFTYVDTTQPEQVAQALREETRMIWLETPTNPLLRVTDIQAIARLAHNHPARPWVAVDNTFATPYLQRPLDLGADIVVHSTTKYLGGHSDVVALRCGGRRGGGPGPRPARAPGLPPERGGRGPRTHGLFPGVAGYQDLSRAYGPAQRQRAGRGRVPGPPPQGEAPSGSRRAQRFSPWPNPWAGWNPSSRCPRP